MTLKDKDANLLPHDPVDKLIKKVVHALGANMLAVKDVRIAMQLLLVM
jgi:hypothetical protein